MGSVPSSKHDLSIDTAPARPKGLKLVLRRVREKASVWLLPIMQRAARAYVGGESLNDALVVARRFAAEGMSSTLSYWNSLDASPRQVADEYLSSIERLAATGLDSYLSIKPPALRFDCGLAAELADQAHRHGIRLHCDSHGPEVADATNAMMQAMVERKAACDVSTTIPGRWFRSRCDVERAIDCGRKVRVVKGEWPDPTDPKRDLRAGFLDVIDRLAGRARHVAVASHNVSLAAEAMTRLRTAGTSCELELLFGLPMTRSQAWAKANGLDVRIYVPYGPGYIPHAINQLRRKPRIAWWILKDILTPKRWK